MSEPNSPPFIEIDAHNAVEMQQVLPCAPIYSSRALDWPGVVLDYYHHPPHEAPEHYTFQHIVAMTISENVQLHQRIESVVECTSMGCGDVVICPAGFQRWCAWEQSAEFLVLSIEQSTFAEALYQTGDTRSLELIPHFQTRDPVIEQIAIALWNEIKVSHQHERFYIDSLLHFLYFHLMQHHTTTGQDERLGPSHPSKRLLQKAIAHMQDDLASDAHLMAIAPRLNISSYELTLLFLNLTGLTPYQYLIRCRIERAKQMLGQHQFSVDDISRLLGFATVYDFQRQFLRLTGITAHRYRSEFVV